MFMQDSVRFPHRSNKDGSFDSICPACLATVISVRNEQDLPRHEAVHGCDPLRLAQLGQLMSKRSERSERPERSAAETSVS